MAGTDAPSAAELRERRLQFFAPRRAEVEPSPAAAMVETAPPPAAPTVPPVPLAAPAAPAATAAAARPDPQLAPAAADQFHRRIAYLRSQLPADAAGALVALGEWADDSPLALPEAVFAWCVGARHQEGNVVFSFFPS